MTRHFRDETVGLCAGCQHARVIESAKGSRFWRCALSDKCAEFQRYPPLPVLRCAGFEPRHEKNPGST